ncbi:hypothetical protein [Clostridium sp. BJN0013]|uniref:hypothetical protein n=1 Tax=Clostridium sp. BJN0013 TaxID=3236840 RepID=UPI0034C60AFB
MTDKKYSVGKNTDISNIKDIFIRLPIWKMNKRPDAIPHNDPTRQSDFRNEKNE